MLNPQTQPQKPKPKRGKTKRAQLKQTEAQKIQLSIDIEQIMRTDLKEFIEVNVRKYGNTFETKLGLTRDDLLNDVREQIWKGLVTYDPTKKAAKITYVYKLIDNRFKLLYRRSKITKFNSIDYYAQWTDCPHIDQNHLITDETSEDLVSKREAMAHVISRLTTFKERKVYGFLRRGLSISDMQLKKFTRVVKKQKIKYCLSRIEIIKIIKKIHQIVTESQQEAT